MTPWPTLFLNKNHGYHVFMTQKELEEMVSLVLKVSEYCLVEAETGIPMFRQIAKPMLRMCDILEASAPPVAAPNKPKVLS